MPIDKQGLHCTFALRRSHPQPRHCAPKTGLDPSPLQDFSLLIRSLLVSAAPGSRTFKPCPGRLVHFFFNFWKKRKAAQLKHFGKQQKVHFKVLRSSRALSKKKKSFRKALKKKLLMLCDVAEGALVKIHTDFLLRFS